jgi:hypothetical protein
MTSAREDDTWSLLRRRTKKVVDDLQQDAEKILAELQLLQQALAREQQQWAGDYDAKRETAELWHHARDHRMLYLKQQELAAHMALVDKLLNLLRCARAPARVSYWMHFQQGRFATSGRGLRGAGERMIVCVDEKSEPQRHGHSRPPRCRCVRAATCSFFFENGKKIDRFHQERRSVASPSFGARE